jgi:hypothetical protein
MTRINLLFPPGRKVSLLVINAILPLIAVITLDSVATGLQDRLVFSLNYNSHLKNLQV